MAIKREDLLSSILNKVRTTYQNSINDNKGFFRQGKFTPSQQLQDIGQTRLPSGITLKQLPQAYTQSFSQSRTLPEKLMNIGTSSFIKASTFGLLQPQAPKAETVSEKFFSGLGSLTGFIGPGSLGTKAMTGIEKLGQVGINRFAPKLGTTLLGKATGGIAKEAAQTAAYVGGKYLSGKTGLRPDEPITGKSVLQDLALGTAVRAATTPGILGMISGTNVKGMVGKNKMTFKPKSVLKGEEIDIIDQINERLGKTKDISWEDNNFLDNVLRQRTNATQGQLDNLTAKQKLNELLTFANRSEGFKGVTMGIKDQSSPIKTGEDGIKVADFDEYLSKKGLSKWGGDVAMAKMPNASEGQRKSLSKLNQKMILDNAQKVEQARIEFDTGVKNGTIKLKTSNEHLIEVANGNPDNQAVIAARNVLEKRGINWQSPLSPESVLPPHLQKLVDKQNAIKPEFTIEDVTPKGFGPAENTQVINNIERLKGETFDQAIARKIGYQIDNGTIKINEDPVMGGWKAQIDGNLVGSQEPLIIRTSNKSQLMDEVFNKVYPNAKSVSPDSKGIKTDLETKLPKQKLPWEEPEYVAKNVGLKTKDSPVLKTGKLKQELNQLTTKAPLKESQRIISPELKTDIKKVEDLAPKKVNLLDYFRTPDRVLKKIGLEKESDLIRQQYNKYLDELPVEIGKISKWYDQVKNTPDANKRLFQYLDGQDVKLDKNELKVAGEMKEYLADWADKLDLPFDKRVTNYITHIFEKDFIKKDFDEDLAKIISEKVPSGVYDPFTQERLGKQGYVEDVFRALDAYTKRAVRKFNMDPALEKLSQASDKLPLESWKYVKSFADRVNLRPTTVDTMIDNLVKQSPIGYKLGQRPVTGTSKKLRQAVYRGTLGLNFGSALRNLTQGANTYAKLGEKYTGIGYIRALKEIASGGDELTTSGVLRDNFIQDRQLSSSKKLMQKLDEGLFSLFNLAEKINRGSAYFGAKAKFLNEGLNEKEAISKAVDLVRDTQFTFGSVDTPVVMQSDLAKTLGQFQSFNIKQTEFLGEMLSGKDVVGLLRWVGANALMMFTVGNLIGIDVQDIIPFGGVFTGETKLGQTPPIQLGTDLYKAGINAPDKYGNVSEDNIIGRIGGALSKNAPAFVPGGVQIKKTIQGIKAVNEEGSFSKTGRLQYPIEKTPENYLRASVFGKSNLPAAREYFDNDGSVLGEKQTEFYKQSTDKQGVYKSFMNKRQEEKAIEVAKEEIKNTGTIQNINGKILYQNEIGDIKTIDIDKVTNLPEQTAYQRALKQKEAFKIVDDVLDNLSGDEQINALQTLGISSEDATYYNTAKQENYLKSIYVEEEIMGMIKQGQNKDQILDNLAGMRKAVNEKVLLADGVINDLVDKNIISYQDGKNLKNIDKDLKPKSLKAKKAKKPKKISLSSKKFTASKKKYNPLKVKSTSTKSRFTPPKYVKADLRTPKKLL